MKLNDTVWGALLLALSFAVLWNIQSFPKIPGQSIGPAAFPGLLAIALAGCAIALIVRGLRADHARLVFGDWMRSRPHVGNFLLTVAVLLFYSRGRPLASCHAALILWPCSSSSAYGVKSAVPDRDRRRCSYPHRVLQVLR